MRWLAVVFVSACTVGGSPSPTNNDEQAPSDDWSVETKRCIERDLHVWLPFGSAWATVRQLDANRCEILIGGETENPMYGGEASQRCVVPRTYAHVVDIELGNGGPAYADDAYCTDV